MPAIPKTVDSGRLIVDSERISATMPSAAKMIVGIQMVGEMNSILRTATCPNQMVRKAVMAEMRPRELIPIFMHHIYDGLHIINWRVLQDAMSEIENVTRPAIGAIQNIVDALFDFRMRRE